MQNPCSSIGKKEMPLQCHPLANDPDSAWDSLKPTQTVCKVQPLPLDLPVYANAVRFVCMSDTHSLTSRLKFPVPPGDVYLHAGDFTNQGRIREVTEFNDFLGSLPHRYKVVIAGNHELSFDPSLSEYVSSRSKLRHHESEPSGSSSRSKKCEDPRQYLTNCIYLEDSATEIYGISIYGSPWQPMFYNWAFNLQRGRDCLEKWNQIPSGVDVLLTHSPPLGHGDFSVLGLRCGCVDLLLSVQNRIKPKYHVFGHIHEGYGITTDQQTVFINCSTCNVKYAPVNLPIIFDIPLKPGYQKL